ncbi:hypothetical protein [uncultured Helicobacter sp.]|uniref:hypothetical protein n=1 Tax=uncultured Helicobacter sp. TaxID=175537 RepID=UPI00375237B6
MSDFVIIIYPFCEIPKLCGFYRICIESHYLVEGIIGKKRNFVYDFCHKKYKFFDLLES